MLKFLRVFLLIGGTFVIGLSLGMTVKMPFPEMAPLTLFGCLSVFVALMSAISERMFPQERNDWIALKSEKVFLN